MASNRPTQLKNNSISKEYKILFDSSYEKKHELKFPVYNSKVWNNKCIVVYIDRGD